MEGQSIDLACYYDIGYNQALPAAHPAAHPWMRLSPKPHCAPITHASRMIFTLKYIAPHVSDCLEHNSAYFQYAVESGNLGILLLCSDQMFGRFNRLF